MTWPPCCKAAIHAGDCARAPEAHIRATTTAQRTIFSTIEKSLLRAQIAVDQAALDSTLRDPLRHKRRRRKPRRGDQHDARQAPQHWRVATQGAPGERGKRSEEHTSELQSLRHLVCRLLLEK